MTEIYLVMTSFDDDETVFEEVVEAYQYLANAQEAVNRLNDAHTALQKYDREFDAHMEQWAKKNKKPEFKPRIGLLTEDQKAAVKAEKSIWAEYVGRENTEKERFEKENYPVLNGISSAGLKAIQEHLFHEGGFTVETVAVND